jgi:steroid delta-isomerase-like uncharacterized protein
MPTIRQMTTLIEEHLGREAAGDAAGAVAVYTHDVQHDVVGSPMGVLTGPDAAQRFYEHLINDLKIENMVMVRDWFGSDFAVMEHIVDAAVAGSFMGIPGHGRSIRFRMLHIWEFRDGKISRENVWLDGGGVVAQLTAPTTGALA